MLWEWSLKLLLVWSQNSICLVLGFYPRTWNSWHWDKMISSNPISSPCGELMGLRPMLWPNLTQNKEVQIPVERIWGSGIDPRVNKMLFWDRSQYSDGSVPQQHIVDSGINPRTPFFWRWDWSQTLIGTSHFHMVIIHNNVLQGNLLK